MLLAVPSSAGWGEQWKEMGGLPVQGAEWRSREARSGQVSRHARQTQGRVLSILEASRKQCDRHAPVNTMGAAPLSSGAGRVRAAAAPAPADERRRLQGGGAGGD